MLVSYKPGGLQVILNLLDALIDSVELGEGLLLLLNHLVLDCKLGLFDGSKDLSELGIEALALLVLYTLQVRKLGNHLRIL